MLEKQEKRIRRHKRVRAKIIGTSEKPRLCVFRSSGHIHAQVIDDENGKTILSMSDIGMKAKKVTKGEEKMEGKTALAFEVGKLIAEKSIEKKIKEVVFDRGGYQYHGRVKALADGAREGGLKF